MAISSNATGLRPGVCTSTTRPTTPYTGQIIFQTDTGTMHNWDGAAWQFLAPTQQRNLLYNGAMQVAQRGTSATSLTGSGYYTVDRWQQGTSGGGTWTQTQESDAPTGSGFRNSLKMLCTTAQASLSASSILYITQSLEGQDCQAIRKGTSQAQQVTLSFWVKSNVTGTYVVSLIDDDNTRDVGKTYTVNSSGTWEFKTLTFPADTTGALANDNGRSLMAFFWLVAGSNFSSGTLNTSWASITNANRAVGQVNLASATNNYWQVTGVQLNVGSVAAPFEFKSFGQELRECQRYYEQSYPVGTAPGTNTANGMVVCSGSTDGGGYLYHIIPMNTQKRALVTTGASNASFVRLWTQAGVADYAAYNRSGASNTTATAGVNNGGIGYWIFYIQTGANWVPAYSVFHWAYNCEL